MTADKRLQMQVRILAYLGTVARPIASNGRTERLGDIPGTGEIVDALGMPRVNKSFAAVSRSFNRLHQAGKVWRWQPEVYLIGKGYRYSLPPE